MWFDGPLSAPDSALATERLTSQLSGRASRAAHRGVGQLDDAELKLYSVLMRPSILGEGGPCDLDGHAVSAR